MAGGFAPKGQRGQEPAPTALQLIYDAFVDRYQIGAVRARNAAGPQLQSPEAQKLRQDVAAHDVKKVATSTRNADDYIKMARQAPTAQEAAVLYGRAFMSAINGAIDTARALTRTNADHATTTNLGPKRLRPAKQELAAFHQQYKTDLSAINSNFAKNRPADKEEATARKEAAQRLQQQGQFTMQLLRDVFTKSGKEREIAIQQFIKARRYYSEMVDALSANTIDLRKFDETTQEANKQLKEVTRTSKDVEKLQEKKSAREQADEQAAMQRGAANENRQQTNLTPQQFANAQQQMLMQQFMQQAANAIQQQFVAQQQAMMQSVSNSLSNIMNALVDRLTGLGIGEAIQGTQDLQDLIDKKKASGDPVGAVDLEIQNVKMRLQQSMLNLHQLSIDPAAGGGFGAFPGSDNSAYFLTLDTPLTREIKSLQAQLDQLEKERHDLTGHGAPRKMASGGIVSGATAALVGEAGPEAVLPLSSFANMLGALPVFSNINSAMESISDSLVAQGRTGEVNRWDRALNQVQSSFDYVSNFVENARRIDLRPQGMLRPLTQGMLMDQELAARHPAYRIGGLSTGDLALHFHGVDISDTAAARQFAQQLLPALEIEARSLGQDMTGRSVFRSPGLTGPGMPGRPYGFAR